MEYYEERTIKRAPRSNTHILNILQNISKTKSTIKIVRK